MEDQGALGGEAVGEGGVGEDLCSCKWFWYRFRWIPGGNCGVCTVYWEFMGFHLIMMLYCVDIVFSVIIIA